MNNLPKEKRIQLAFVAVGVVGVIAGLWFGVISMQKKKIQAIASRSDSLQREIDKERKVITGSSELGRQLGEATNRINEIEAQMPSGDLYSWIVGAIRQFNVPTYKVDLHQFSSPSSGDVRMFADFPYSQAVVSVSGTAYYFDLGKFIADFENHFPYMRVQNLNLDPMAGASPQEAEKLYFRMEIVTLIKPTAALVANQ
jgi:Tfp pilus assembly protein PilO